MTNELKEKVIELRKEGKTYNQISEELNVAKSSISDICRKLGLGNGITIKKLTPELIEKAQKLYDNIGNLKEVSKLIGVGSERLSKVINLKKREITKTRSESVIDWRKRTKLKLIEYKGGKCQICGYNKCISALEFHHVNPEEKDFGISGQSRSFEKLKNEVDKCVLVCANCHREIHDGITECPQL